MERAKYDYVGFGAIEEKKESNLMHRQRVWIVHAFTLLFIFFHMNGN
jgi:hypothetical protein